MPTRVPPIARIRLAKSLPRLLALPLLLVLAGVAIAVVAAFGATGVVVIAGIAAGALVVVVGIAWALVPLSVRLEVEESAVGVSWLGGERIYPLTPGPVTRVRLRGQSASRLRARSGPFGWGLGRARLRDDEAIEVVRLAPTATAILVPTERGRLAIAAADDDELLDALSHAARARQRLDALADGRLPEAPEEASAEPEERAAQPGEPAAEPHEPAAQDELAESEPGVLTGIERAQLEQRLAEDRLAATMVAEAERDTAAVAVRAPEEAEPAPPADVRAPATARAPRLTALRRPRPRAAFVLLPVVAAGIAWGLGTAQGSMPEPGTDLARLTALALVLAGPATSVGAIMALAWWPRLVGVVVAGGLAASVFIGRALIGA